VPNTSTDAAKAAIVQTMLSNTSQFRALLDLGGCFTELNQLALDFLGIKREVLFGQPIWGGNWWLSETTRLEVHHQTQQAALGNFSQAEYEIESQGQRLWIEFLLKPIRNPAGDVIMILAEGNNISERKRLEGALRDSEERHRTLVETMSEGVVQQEADGRITMCNPAAEQILGLNHDQMMGRTSVDPSWRSVREDGSEFPGEEHPAMITLRTGQAQSEVVMGVHKPSGELTWILINSRPLQHFRDPLPYAVVTTFTEITKRKELEDKLRQAALYDALTGLATRTLLLERLNHALAHNKRHPHNKFALLFIDLDNFKKVNDTLGHGAGDDLLKQVATKLKAQVRETDTVARLGGDEFVVLLEGLEAANTANAFAERMLEHLRLELPTATGSIAISASIGIAVPDQSLVAAQDLLTHADKAMYHAKSKGKNTFTQSPSF
jgi:diguanylate cyclase (GGDEF)-like protein/PAS domain S-box-containing protein